MPVVQVENLHKAYGSLVAVNDISFDVQEGEIFGMVGPNGAGKTTTIECIEGLRRPSGGSIRTLGLDPRSEGYELRERIGVQLQESELWERIRVREVLDLYASFYHRSVDLHPLLDQLGLTEKTNTHFSKLSGGQKQRLSLARAFIRKPKILVLDDSTSAVDAKSEEEILNAIQSLSRDMTTLVISQKISTIKDMDKIIVLNNKGELDGFGTHEHLLKDSMVYKEIALSQVGNGGAFNE